MDTDRLLESFGLSRNFTKSDLDQAYKDLVQVWHPDKYSYNPRLQHKVPPQLTVVTLPQR
jgi:DnaJ-class molecular chaperone